MSAAALKVAPAPSAVPLPRLRADLKFEMLTPPGGGFPNLVVHDPVKATYYKVEWPQSGLLYLWRDATSFDDLVALSNRIYGNCLSQPEIMALVEFLFANQLTETDSKGSWQRYADVASASKHGLAKTVIHGYLFFRVPLFHPDQWLKRMLPRLLFVYSQVFWIFVLAIGLVGTYLATRQWDDVMKAFARLGNLQGLHIYAIAVFALKIIHEFGHALTTARYGCRVPTMGVAFMMGTPVMYTDTTDSWRLVQRGQRLAIVFAGVAAEVIVAAFAILIWAFLEDGFAREICFAFATTSIVLSITVNLNPFMRYDGYFALSDYLEIPNLQPRSFGLALWKLREIMFGLGKPAPENFPLPRQRMLIAYAVTTAFYRLSLYLGIAALVYVMAGKALGIVLGLFEIIVFIGLPIFKEALKWWSLRGEMKRSLRPVFTAGIFAAGIAGLFYPWITSIQIPAVMVASQETALYLPGSAKLDAIRVKEGQVVAAGDILFKAERRDLANQLKVASLQRDAILLQTNRLTADDKKRPLRTVIESSLEQANQQIFAISKEVEQLDIVAPFAGKIVDLDPEIAVGNWLNPSKPLAKLISTSGAKAKAMLRDEDIERVQANGAMTFVPDDARVPVQKISMMTIAPASNGQMGEPILAEHFGGQVPTKSENGQTLASQGWFEVELSADAAAPMQIMRGVARIESIPVSPMQLAWKQITRVLVREQGF